MEAVKYLMGAYFHQDWDIDGGLVSDTVSAFLRERRLAQRHPHADASLPGVVIPRWRRTTSPGRRWRRTTSKLPIVMSYAATLARTHVVCRHPRASRPPAGWRERTSAVVDLQGREGAEGLGDDDGVIAGLEAEVGAGVDEGRGVATDREASRPLMASLDPVGSGLSADARILPAPSAADQIPPDR